MFVCGTRVVDNAVSHTARYGGCTWVTAAPTSLLASTMMTLVRELERWCRSLDTTLTAPGVACPEEGLATSGGVATVSATTRRRAPRAHSMLGRIDRRRMAARRIPRAAPSMVTSGRSCSLRSAVTPPPPYPCRASRERRSKQCRTTSLSAPLDVLHDCVGAVVRSGPEASMGRGLPSRVGVSVVTSSRGHDGARRPASERPAHVVGDAHEAQEARHR